MRKIPLFCVAAVLVMACEKPQQTPSPVPDPGPTPVVENKIPINISMLPFTKATDSAFESGDVVGLWVVNSGNNFTSSGNHADNVSLTFDGSSWKAASQLYWKDESTPASFYCYYPRVASVSDVKALPFSVKADQSALAEYRASDLLWGCKLNVTPTANAVEIQTHHRMSNLLVYLLPGNGYTAESLEEEGVELKINALKPACTLDLQSGTVTAVGGTIDIIPYREADHYRALVPPQEIQDQTLISVKVGSYSFSLKTSINLKTNTQHKVTLTINKVSEGFNIGIGDWETDDMDYGGTVN